MHASLSLAQARRIALAAQGLDKVRPAGPVTARAVGRTFARLHLVQIDSVNVLSRSHFLPFFSRLGNYDRRSCNGWRDAPAPDDGVLGARGVLHPAGPLP